MSMLLLTLVTALLFFELAVGAFVIKFWWCQRRDRKAAEALLHDLEGFLTTTAIAPRGWPEEQDPMLAHQDIHIGDTGEWSEIDDEPQCPAIGTWGIHSDEYLEDEGSCQYCGAVPPKPADD